MILCFYGCVRWGGDHLYLTGSHSPLFRTRDVLLAGTSLFVSSFLDISSSLNIWNVIGDPNTRGCPLLCVSILWLHWGGAWIQHKTSDKRARFLISVAQSAVDTRKIPVFPQILLIFQVVLNVWGRARGVSCPITLSHCSDLGKKKKTNHFCSSAALLLFFNIFRQEYCILSWRVKVREKKPWEEREGNSVFWGCKRFVWLCHRLLGDWRKSWRNPGFCAGNGGSAGRGWDGGSYPQKSKELSPFLSLLPDVWALLFHVSKIDAFPSKII